MTDEMPVAFTRRGCLTTTVVAASMLVIVVVLLTLLTRTSGPSPLPRGTGPDTSTSAPGYTPLPGPTFSAEVDLVLTRAWSEGRYGCGITGPAIDGLAAALERDIGEAPPLESRIVAASWVNEHCRDR